MTHDFPEWIEVEDRAGFWHDGTNADRSLTVTLGVCAGGSTILFAWTLWSYGPLLGWW